ncbi:MAG: DmsE family decaheme c-type cytochrome [Cycloclasticus sp.]|jgi:DmsE family decaheme c-type cytochrome
MDNRNVVLTRFFRLAILLVSFTVWVNTGWAQTADLDGKSSRDVVMRGDASCTKCHDEDQAYPVLQIGKTKHGVTADSRTPTCTSCHGESAEHIKSGRDKDRASPDINFRNAQSAVPRHERVNSEIKWPQTPAAEQSAVCLSCHQGGHRMFWDSSSHANRDVACSSCHQVHAAHDRVSDKKAQTELCFNCHKEQRAQLHRPSHHPVLEGEMGCSDCHNPHGSAGTKQLVKDSVNETCFQCHAEKRGPFVHNHQPVTEDCTICHNPHGTTIAKMLKSRSPYLCQQCHSNTRHPTDSARIPGAPTTSRSGLSSVGRGCLNCHTNIHGSNSSEDTTAPGRFVR